MNTSLEQIVNAVLYEGYILYPYRASSQKNQRERFTFGRVYPQIYSESQNGAEKCELLTECLLQSKSASRRLEVTLGFLQPMQREIGALPIPLMRLPDSAEPHFQLVPQLEIDGKLYQTWTEAIERKVSVSIEQLPSKIEKPFVFEEKREFEPILNGEGKVAGLMIRKQELLRGEIEIQSQSLEDNLWKISIRVRNNSPLNRSDLEINDNILRRTFVSTHVVLQVRDSEFVSLLETPPEFKKFADDCQNVGVWPVLVGDETKAERHTMLASPIILYDYPKISPESTGDFFDGTEIDEMLTLRVLTMTDAEKREMHVDDFSRRILERTHALNPEGFMKLHGGMRETNFSNEEFFNPTKPVKSFPVDGVELKAGDRVFVRPKKRADAIDMILSGKIAIIEAVEQDAENKIHFALVLEDDPGRDLGFARQSGHRFFYGADEVEPCLTEVGA